MSVTTSGSVSGSGFISDERTEEGLLKVHGIALGDNDVTRGSKSGEEKIWLPDVLKESAHRLSGKDIVVDHDNRSAYKTVGQVTNARYKEGTGVIYQGVVQDEELEPKIQHGWLDVSPKLIHSEDHDDVDGIKAPKEIMDFPNLSIVRKGASPSNELNVGEHAELSVEELQAAFDDTIESEAEYHFVDEELESDIDYSAWLYETAEGAQGAAQAFPCDGIHQHDVQGKTWYMPCSDHDSFLRSLKNMKSDEMAEYGEDDYVQWDNGSAHGQIVDWTDDGVFDSEIDGDVSVEGTEDDPAALIQIHQEKDDGWMPQDTMVGHKFSTLNEWDPDNVLRADANESLAPLDEELDEVYSDWDDAVNMTASELERWSGNPCSREASVDPEAVIERNLNLLETPKSDWGAGEVDDAKRTISFINRMSNEENEPDDPRDGSFGCPSKWAISLLNWAYNPFDSIPERPDNDDLDEVEELEMAKYGEYSKEERKMASQMSSHSEMTKMESLGLLSSMKPNRPNDLDAMAKMLASSLGVHKEEMRKMMDEMAKHSSDSMGRYEMEESMQNYLDAEDSNLNKIFE